MPSYAFIRENAHFWNFRKFSIFCHFFARSYEGQYSTSGPKKFFPKNFFLFSQNAQKVVILDAESIFDVKRALSITVFAYSQKNRFLTPPKKFAMARMST